MAAIFVFLGIVFDFFDGFLARKLGVQGPLGIQLDSLADMITSGLVPGIILFKLMALSVNDTEMFTHEWNAVISWQGFKTSPLVFLTLLVPVASAYRLARFNIDEDQQTSFTALPTPANALLIVSLPLILEFQGNDLINSIILNKWFLIGLTFFSTLMLNANIKLFALKFKDWTFKSNATRCLFLILALVSILIMKFAAIPFIVLLYIIMSLLTNVSK
mgnify:FL=1